MEPHGRWLGMGALSLEGINADLMELVLTRAGDYKGGDSGSHLVFLFLYFHVISSPWTSTIVMLFTMRRSPGLSPCYHAGTVVLDLQNCELNEPPIFINYQALSMML